MTLTIQSARRILQEAVEGAPRHPTGANGVSSLQIGRKVDILGRTGHYGAVICGTLQRCPEPLVRFVVCLHLFAAQGDDTRPGRIKGDLLAGLGIVGRAPVDGARLARPRLVCLSLGGAHEEPVDSAVLVLGNRVAEIGALWARVDDGVLGVDVEGQAAKLLVLLVLADDD